MCAYIKVYRLNNVAIEAVINEQYLLHVIDTHNILPSVHLTTG